MGTDRISWVMEKRIPREGERGRAGKRERGGEGEGRGECLSVVFGPTEVSWVGGGGSWPLAQPQWCTNQLWAFHFLI